MDREHDEARLYGDEAAQTGIAALELLANKAVADTVHAGAVVALDRAAEQSEFGDLADQVLRELVLLEGFPHDGYDAIVDEAAHGVFDHGLVVGKFGLDIVEIERIECFGAHGMYPGSGQGRRF